MRRVIKALFAVCAAGWLVGCGSSDSDSTPSGGRLPDPGDVAAVTAELEQAESCDDLLGDIHADAIARVDLLASLLRTAGVEGLGGASNSDTGGVGISEDARGVPGGGADFSNATDSADGTAAAPQPADTGPSDPAGAGADSQLGADGSGGTSGGGEAEEVVGPSGFSDTNRQVAEVDEADIIKVDDDGNFLYLLHGDRLVVLKSWPASETARERELVLDQPLDGRPYEMFVQDGRVVVFSGVYSERLSSEDSGDVAAPQPASFPADCWECWGGSSPFTKLTFIDMNASQPSKVRELFFEGQYVSSRRHDATVRAIIRGGFKAPRLYRPSIEYVDPWGNPYPQEALDEQIGSWRERMIGAIEQSTLDDWLPAEHELVDGELTEVERRCTDFYTPAPGLTSQGMTNIVQVDLADPGAAVGGALVLGDASVVYSNTTSLLLAHQDWRAGELGMGELRTAVHSFGIDASSTTYRASGFVDGSILNQFSLDERDGVIRLTTTESRWDETTGERVTDNRLRTMRAEDGELTVIGETENLGKPRETIRSTRFVGDKAYVVTFEQIDPLVVVDLQDPEDPQILGSVEIPGFSSYMHPLGDDHLLTIGEFRDPQTGGNRTLQLQIFDVSSPTDPQVSDQFLFPLGGNSLAQQQHKAFNYYSDRQLLAFPYVNWRTQDSTLELFRIAVDSGFERLGSVSHRNMLNNCAEEFDAKLDDLPPEERAAIEDELAQQRGFYSCPAPSVRRGVFIDDFVYSLSYGGLLVHEVGSATLESSDADAVARIDLERPRYPDWGGYAGGGITPGSGPVRGSPGVAVDNALPPPDGAAGAPAPGVEDGAAGSGGATGSVDAGVGEASSADAGVGEASSADAGVGDA